jgi:hypothetical protein
VLTTMAPIEEHQGQAPILFLSDRACVPSSSSNLIKEFTMTKTITRFAFRTTPRDLLNIEILANALRDAGRTFTTRTDAIRLCLEAAATDPTRMIIGETAK